MTDHELEVFKEANDLCRSALAIASREGKMTNWVGFENKLKISLQRQQNILYPVYEHFRSL